MSVSLYVQPPDTVCTPHRFNNGCDIGSSQCDGVTGQKIPCCVDKFVYTGSGTPDPWKGDGVAPDPKYVASFDRSKMRPKFIGPPLCPTT